MLKKIGNWFKENWLEVLFGAVCIGTATASGVYFYNRKKDIEEAINDARQEAEKQIEVNRIAREHNEEVWAQKLDRFYNSFPFDRDAEFDMYFENKETNKMYKHKYGCLGEYIMDICEDGSDLEEVSRNEQP